VAKVHQPVAKVFRHECGGIRVEPAIASVRQAVTTRVHVGVGQQVRAAPVLLGQVKTEGNIPALYTRATFEPPIRLALSQSGYTIKRSGNSPQLLPPPCQVPGFEPADRGLLQLVREHDWALIRHDPKAVDAARLVAQVALAWPERTLVVAARRRQEVYDLAGRLRAFLPTVSVVTARDKPAAVDRVVVATYEGLGHTASYRAPGHKVFDVSWVNTVVVPDALEATGRVALRCLSRAVRARLYGLIDMAARPAPLERDHLAFLFGFQELTVPYHGCRERPVRVAHCRIQGGPELPLASTGVLLERRGLWQHPVRNRKVRQLASAFRTGDEEELGRLLGVTISAPPPGVLVLVANVEQALALAPQLPGWPVVAGPGVLTDGLTAEQACRLRALPDPCCLGPLHAIVTPTALSGTDLARVGVLVRADGGGGLPPFGPEALVERDDAPARPLLVVDFLDRHHPVLRSRSRRRRAAYEDRGWFGPGVNPAEARAAHFLDNRPTGARDER
jgi:hypothetical protein